MRPQQARSHKEAHRIYRKIPETKRRQATGFLFGRLKDQDQIREAIKDNPEVWWADYHFIWGMSIRNLLRTNGMGEDFFDVANLDDIYVELVEEAMALGAKIKFPGDMSSKR